MGASHNILFCALPCLIAFLSVITLIRQEGSKRISENHIAILGQINTSLDSYLENVGICMQYVWEDFGINQLLSKDYFMGEEKEVMARMTINDFISEKSKIGIRESCNLSVICESGYCYSTKENVNDSTMLYPDLESLREEEWFEDVMKNSRFHYIATSSSPEYLDISKKSAMHVVCGMKDFEKGDFIGIIDVSIPKEKVINILNRTVSRDEQVVALVLFKDSVSTQWNYLMAVTAVIILPLLLLFFVAQKSFVEGIVSSGIKG